MRNTLKLLYTKYKNAVVLKWEDYKVHKFQKQNIYITSQKEQGQIFIKMHWSLYRECKVPSMRYF